MGAEELKSDGPGILHLYAYLCYSLTTFESECFECFLRCKPAVTKPQTTHRVAIADFWRTFHHDGKISPGW